MCTSFLIFIPIIIPRFRGEEIKSMSMITIKRGKKPLTPPRTGTASGDRLKPGLPDVSRHSPDRLKRFHKNCYPCLAPKVLPMS